MTQLDERPAARTAPAADTSAPLVRSSAAQVLDWLDGAAIASALGSRGAQFGGVASCKYVVLALVDDDEVVVLTEPDVSDDALRGILRDASRAVNL